MKEKKKWISTLILGMALLCGLMALKGYMAERNAGRSYDELQEQAGDQEPWEKSSQIEQEPTAAAEESTPEPEPTESASEAEPTIPVTESTPEPEPVECPIDFEAVTGECPDCYAWIRIPDTNIDYPIVQSASDNAFYLNHNAYGDYEFAGAIYTEDFNARDFNDPNTVIYGHNMKNGSMFQNLHYFEDLAFMEDHPTFEIYLPDKILTYQVFAAYVYDDRHLLATYDFTDRDVFRLYLTEILNQRSMSANIDRDVEVTEDSKIVTLSTCNGISDERYLVQGVLLSEKIAIVRRLP